MGDLTDKQIARIRKAIDSPGTAVERLALVGLEFVRAFLDQVEKERKK